MEVPLRDRKSDSHRAAGARLAGRKLTDKEVVHHKDEDKTNNADTNLAVEPRGKHTADHNRTRPLSKLRASLHMHREGKKLY